ncbi:phosphoribosylglycinamide synthetase, C domain protein [Mycobacterium xenopi 3993]|nr:phosphoribosylglycinamide synthetase, C domain protein [Mycobacterium xenopi 3993]
MLALLESPLANCFTRQPPAGWRTSEICAGARVRRWWWCLRPKTIRAATARRRSHRRGGRGRIARRTARRDDGAIVSSGGRVLSVVGTGPDLAAARSAAYHILDSIKLPGGTFAATSDCSLRRARSTSSPDDARRWRPGD